MRDFSTIQTRFWIDPVMQDLSAESRLIALYVAAGPHTTMLGAFRLPKSYVAEDLKMGIDTVSKGYAELSARHFFSFDEKSSWLVVRDFFKWNPIHNPKHGQAIQKLFEQVPKGISIFGSLVAVLQSQRYLNEAFRKELDTVCKGSRRNLDTVSKPYRYTDKDKDKEMDKDKEGDKDSEVGEIKRKEQDEENGVLSHIVAPARPGDGVSPDMILVFNTWKTLLGHPQAILDKKRRAWIRQALQAGYSASQLCQAIKGCSLTPHNMGKNDRGQRYDGLHVILRDADQIERFIRNAQSPPRERNAAEALSDSNAAVGEEWLRDKLSELEEAQHGTV